MITLVVGNLSLLAIKDLKSRRGARRGARREKQKKEKSLPKFLRFEDGHRIAKRKE